MVDLSGAISQMAILVLIACAGYAAAKLGYIDAPTRGKLTQILLNITLPCMIIASVGDLDSNLGRDLILWMFGLAAAQFFLLLACGVLCNAVLRVRKEERPLYLFMSVCTNTGFVGLPVVAAIYGNQTVLASSIFVMVLAFFMYSIGFAILAGNASGEGSASGLSRSGESVALPARISATLRGLPWKSIVNPAMVASIVAIAMFLGGVRVPGVLEDAMSMLGSVTSPIAMMIVGALMASSNVRAVVGELRLYPFIIIRQLIVPAALFFLLRTFVPSAELVAVFVVMFAMPVGSMVPSFVERFGRDPVLPAKGTVLSTIASFLIIPALVAVMMSL